MKSRPLILAGDIGGTKTTLGYFDLKSGILNSKAICTFPSVNYTDFKFINNLNLILQWETT